MSLLIKTNTMNIKIEKDVPIPQKNKSRYTEYPFAEMNVGDSFFVEIPVGKRSDVVRGQVYNKASDNVKRKTKIECQHN